MSKTKLSNNEYKRKLEHQIYLAQEHPARIYDLTDCNISEVPKGVFTYCKVLRKYSLNLSENNLCSLQSGGNLEDLSYLGALVLSKNAFKSLLADFSKLSNLKKLLLDYNKLQKFPVVLTELPNLKILNLEGNLIKVIPKEVNKFKSLENLNLSKNPVNMIFPELCEIASLKIVNIDLDLVKNIPDDVRRAGFDAVWKIFCEIRRVPFRKINDNINEGKAISGSNKHSDGGNCDLRYTKIGEEIEREIIEHEQNVSIVEYEDRRKSMDAIRKKIDIENDLITEILSKKMHENDRLLNAIKYEEINTNELINKIFEYNSRAQKREELRNKIEERNTIFIDTSINLSRESKNEILDSMKQLLQTSINPSRKPCYFMNSFAESKFSMNKQLTFEQENEQKLAFQQLQLEKDPQLSRLRDGMGIIEKKLQQLSVEDMIEGSLANDFNRGNRAHLVKVLQDLTTEKHSREIILNSKIAQMECTRDKSQKDFWITQYQNLLDDKAKSDFEVRELLKMADMEQWIPVFLKYDYTIDMMLDLTPVYLSELGIKSELVQMKFLNFLNEWKFNPIKSQKLSKPTAPSETYEKDTSESISPSAPPLPNLSNVGVSETPCGDNSVVLARKEAECCICLTLEARMLLLNCGHVCCCKECSFTVKQCPLCRQVIIQRVNLEFSI